MFKAAESKGGQNMTQEMRWLDEVEVRLLDGSSLGSARLRLRRTEGSDGRPRWTGEMRTPIRAETKPWPENGLVDLCSSDGRRACVRLESGMREVGPVLLQVAHVRADEGDLAALIQGS
jgi:hypothetical protein